MTNKYEHSCWAGAGFRPCTDRTRGLWELLLGRSERLAEAVQLLPDKKKNRVLPAAAGLSVWCRGWSYMIVNIHPDCRLSTCQTRLIFPGDRGWFPAVRRGERGQRALSTLWVRNGGARTRCSSCNSVVIVKWKGCTCHRKCRGFLFYYAGNAGYLSLRVMKRFRVHWYEILLKMALWILWLHQIKSENEESLNIIPSSLEN